MYTFSARVAAVMKVQQPADKQTFFHPLPYSLELSLDVCDTPVLELKNLSTYLLFENPTQGTVPVIDRKSLEMLIDCSLHCFELSVPIIGEPPLSLHNRKSS